MRLRPVDTDLGVWTWAENGTKVAVWRPTDAHRHHRYLPLSRPAVAEFCYGANRLVVDNVALFPVFDIHDEDAVIPETLGTKEKFWIKHGGDLKLLKFGREGTGEDWAEKLACELCGLLRLPHAHYDLARYNGRGCVLSPSMIPTDGRLILGNELISGIVKNYDGTRSYRQREHTVGRVHASLKTHTTNAQYAESWHNFVGYLLLDAWIGNTDRHHENWGLIIDKERVVTLAPTFDHASSMGRELLDEQREARLKTADSRYDVAAFSARAKSALYADPKDKHPLPPISAFQAAMKIRPESGTYWLDRLADVHDGLVHGVLNRIPPECMSVASRHFAMAVLTTNKAALIALLGAPE